MYERNKELYVTKVRKYREQLNHEFDLCCLCLFRIKYHEPGSCFLRLVRTKYHKSVLIVFDSNF